MAIKTNDHINTLSVERIIIFLSLKSKSEVLNIFKVLLLFKKVCKKVHFF